MNNIKEDCKTVEITVRLWTNGLAREDGNVKTAWEFGAVYVKANKTLGIKSSGVEHFTSLEDLPRAIEKVTALVDVALVYKGRIRKPKV